MASQNSMYHQDLGPIMRQCELSTAGENVAYGYSTGRSVVNDGWMHSEGHRANILSSSYRIMGIGARKGSDGTLVRRAGVRPQGLSLTASATGAHSGNRGQGDPPGDPVARTPRVR